MIPHKLLPFSIQFQPSQTNTHAKTAEFLFFFGNDIRSWTFISEIKDMLCCMCKKGIKAVCNLIGGGINGDVHVCYT